MRERPDLGLFFAVLLVAGSLATRPFGNGSEGRTVDLLHAMSQGRFWIDPEVEGRTFDRAIMAQPPPAALASLGVCTPRGTLERFHIYSGGSPGHAFTLFPAYVIFEGRVSSALCDFLLVLLGAALPHALATVAVRRAAERAGGLSHAASVTAALAYAFGTLALPYGAHLYQHAPALAALAWALALVLRRPEVEGAPRCALAGTLAAWAVACDYNFALVATGVGVLALTRGGLRGALAFTLGTIPPACLLALYHKECFGSPFETAYSHRADAGLRAVFARGYLGFAWPQASVLSAIVVGRRGLLVTSPLALVGIAGLVARARQLGFALAITLLELIAIAGRTDWHGGWSVGVRYTLPAIPFAALGIPAGLALLGRAARPVAALSVIAAWVGTTVDWDYVESPLAHLCAFEILGPRTRALSSVILGTRPLAATPATSLLSAAVLSVVFVLAHRLARPRARGWLMPVILGLAPWIASVPFQVRSAVSGSARVREVYTYAYADALETIAEANDDPGEAASLVGAARAIGDPGTLLFALERACKLDPRNPDLASERATLRARLGR